MIGHKRWWSMTQTLIVEAVRMVRIRYGGRDVIMQPGQRLHLPYEKAGNSSPKPKEKSGRLEVKQIGLPSGARWQKSPVALLRRIRDVLRYSNSSCPSTGRSRRATWRHSDTG